MDQELLLARQALKQGQHAQAQMLVNQYVQAHPADSAGWLLLAEISADPQQRQAALAQAARVAQSDRPAPSAPAAPANQRLLLLAGILVVLVIAIAAALRLPSAAAIGPAPEDRVLAYLDDLVRLWGNPALEDPSQREELLRTLVAQHYEPTRREGYIKIVGSETNRVAQATDITRIQAIYASDPAAYIDAGFNHTQAEPGTLLVHITSPMLVWQDSSGTTHRLKLDERLFGLAVKVREIDGGWYLD